MINFKQSPHTTALAHWTGLASIATAVILLATGTSPWWLLLWLVSHLVLSCAVSVALHRYFAHGSFTTTRVWHCALGVLATVVLRGSAIGWAASHRAHHKHADTQQDPRYGKLDYLVHKQKDSVRVSALRAKHLVRDPWIVWLHRHGLLVILLLAALLAAVHPLALLFGYLAPLGSSHVSGAIHRVLSHRGGAPHNLPVLNWLIPTAGEWMHSNHHDNPRDPQLGRQWWHGDYGYLVIKVIKI